MQFILKTVRNLLFTVMAVFSSLCHAYDGWSGELQINSIRVYSASLVLVTMQGAANPGNCSDTSYLALTSPDTESGKRAYSALLTAYSTGKKVTLALTGCSEGGSKGFPIIEQVWLK